MKELHGYEAASIISTIHGTGIAYFGWNLTKLRDPVEADPYNTALVGATKLGATKGNFKFDVKPVWLDVGLDGVRPNSKNGKRLDYNEVKMSTSIAEMTPAKLLKLITNSKSTVIANDYTEITEDMTLCGWPTYINNVGFAVSYGDCAQPLPAIFILKNALNEAGISIGTEDKDVGTTPIEFMGHYDPAVPAEAAWSIFIPTPA